MPSMKPRHAPN